MIPTELRTPSVPASSRASSQQAAWLACLTASAWALLASISTVPAAPPNPNPLTPAEIAHRQSEMCTVKFKVETAVPVTDTTDGAKPLEVQLVDARNDDENVEPTLRAGIVVRIPATARERFGAADLQDLVNRFQNKIVVVTGKVETEPHPVRRDARGNQVPRPTITVTDPNQIRTEG